MVKLTCKDKLQSKEPTAESPEQPQGSVGAALRTHKAKTKPKERGALPACQGNEGSSLWSQAVQREDESQSLSGVLLSMICTSGQALNWSFGFLDPLPPVPACPHPCPELCISQHCPPAPATYPLCSPRLVHEPCRPQWTPSSSSPPILRTPNKRV